MQVTHAHAALTTSDAIDESLTTIVARSVLEAALAEGEPSTLWFEVGDDEDSRRIEVDLSTADLEELLRMSGSDDVALTLDGDEIAGLFGEPPDVEGHGLKGAIAIVVTGAALLAPAGQAAVTQVSPAATAQISPAATAQISPEATTQISPEATTQLRPAATAQVTNAAATAQVATVKAKLAKSNAKFKNFKILRGGLLK
jgi:cytoskeletal protein RodZ